MTMPFYSSVDQLLRDRSELARKGIARGRSVVVLTYAGGVLFVAENHSPSLRKVSEIYDRIGFAAVGRYNEFETLRNAGIRIADVPRLLLRPARRHRPDGWPTPTPRCSGPRSSSSRSRSRWSCASPRSAPTPTRDQLYRITYDGSITDEPQFVVMGGTTDPISAKLQGTYQAGLAWPAPSRSPSKASQAGPAPGGGNGAVGGAGARRVGAGGRGARPGAARGARSAGSPARRCAGCSRRPTARSTRRRRPIRRAATTPPQGRAPPNESTGPHALENNLSGVRRDRTPLVCISSADHVGVNPRSDQLG